MKTLKKIAYTALVLAPGLAFAQNLTALQNILNFAKTTLGTLIPLAFGLAVLYFFYGIAKYVLAAGDPDAAKEGKSIMIYGVIAIAVMASVWGLVAWLQNTLGVSGINSGAVPSITNTNNALQ